MSGSSSADLVSFVAAVLKDRVVADMKTENDMLKEIIRKQLLVQVTGPNGFPIYYEESMKNGCSTGNKYWSVKFNINQRQKRDDKNNNEHIAVVLPFKTIMGLEIRLGSTVIQRFNTHTLKGICNVFPTDVDPNNKATPQMCGIGFEPNIRSRCNDGPVACIEARIGPMLYDDYKDLDELNNNMIDELNVLHTKGCARDLIISEIEFQKKNISGIMSLLKDMRIIKVVDTVINKSEENSTSVNEEDAEDAEDAEDLH